MPASVRSKAIEPFFTTRAGSGGTGLGLSIVYGFINQSGGRLEIDSREGRGTRVIVSLPLAQEPLGDQDAFTGLRALLIDDNEVDRNATAKVLDHLGFDARTGTSAKEAIDAMGEEPFQLIVSDFDLGGAEDGLHVLRHAKAVLPNARCILISGKSVLEDARPGDISFIDKPVTGADVAAAFAARKA